MAYAIAGNSVCQVTCRGRLFGQEVMNVFHWRVDSGGGVIPDGAAFLGDFFAELSVVDTWFTKYLACLAPNIQNINADFQWIDLDRFVKRNFIVAGGGAAVHIPTTANNAAVILLRADIADKRSLGVKHIPGLGGSAVAAGVLTGGITAALGDFGQQAILPVDVGARTMNPIVFGRARPEYTDKHGVLHPAIPKSYRLITSYTVEDTARVMRRRTVGLGI